MRNKVILQLNIKSNKCRKTKTLFIDYSQLGIVVNIVISILMAFLCLLKLKKLK